MVKIHFSYDKKTLVDIIKHLNIDIEIDVWTTRHNICKELVKYLSEYNLHYLTLENQAIKLTVAQKQLIVVTAKQVSSYALTIDKKEIFATEEEFFSKVESILPHGDIPSIRKAIWRTNYYFGTNYKVDMSPQQKTILDRQAIVKKYKNNYGLTVKTGKFVISFD